MWSYEMHFYDDPLWRRKMKNRLLLYEIWCVVTIPKSYLYMTQYLSGPRYKNVNNKVEGLRSGLSRLKIISCFLFRCQKRSSNWIIHMIFLISVDSIFTHPNLIVSIYFSVICLTIMTKIWRDYIRDLTLAVQSSSRELIFSDYINTYKHMNNILKHIKNETRYYIARICQKVTSS